MGIESLGIILHINSTLCMQEMLEKKCAINNKNHTIKIYCPGYEKLFTPQWSRWVVACMFPVLDRRMHCNARRNVRSTGQVAVCSGGTCRGGEGEEGEKESEQCVCRNL